MVDSAGELVRIGHRMVDRSTVQGIKTASTDSGVSFHYLLAKAAQESDFDPGAQAKTSSATGLFQFTRATWLDMMRRHGDKIGFKDMAEQIFETAAGKLKVLDEGIERKILALRNDPDVSAHLAAFFADGNAQTLTTALGRTPAAGELYLAHFLGAYGATALLTTADQDPHKAAADVMPAAAAANRAVFFEADGSARTASGVVDWLKSRFAERLDETADIAALFEPEAAPAPSAEANTNNFMAFDMDSAWRRNDMESFGLSNFLLQNLARMIAAQPMMMVDDPFSLAPSGFGMGDWGSALTQAYGPEVSAASASTAYRKGGANGNPSTATDI